MKQFLLYSLGLLIIINISSCSDDFTSPTSQDKEEIEEKISDLELLKAKYGESTLINLDKATEYSKKLTQIFNGGKTRALTTNDYPEYFGGSFTNDEGNFIIYVTQDSIKYREKLSQLLGTNDINIQMCNYSYKNLNEIMDYLDNYKLDGVKSEVSNNMVGWGLYARENCIKIELKDYSDARIQEFKDNIMDSPAITFEKYKGEIQLCQTLQPGMGITNGTNWGSIGYKAWLNGSGKQGIIVSGHLVPNTYDYHLYYGNSRTPFATVTYTQMSGSIDAAFCEITDPAYFAINTIAGTNYELSTEVIDPDENNIINMRGYVSKTKSSKVISVRQSHYFSETGANLVNLITSTLPTQNGDSGGIIYKLSTSGQRSTVGIIIGIHSGISYACKASEINRAFNCSRL